MRMLTRPLVMMLLTLASLAPPLPAAPKSGCQLHGFVTDAVTYAPIADATVTIRSWDGTIVDHTTATGSWGSGITIFGGPGNVTITAGKTGYQSQSAIRTIPANGTIRQDFNLIPTSLANINLMPYKPSGWSAPIVVGTTAEPTQDALTIYDNQTVYFNSAYGNVSSAAVDDGFDVIIYLDGKPISNTTQIPPFQPLSYATVSGSPGLLTEGTHTLRIVVDSGGSISETNEQDNEYSKSFTITAVTAQAPDIRVAPKQIVFDLRSSQANRNSNASTAIENDTFTIYNDGNALLHVSTMVLDSEAPWLAWSPPAPLSIDPIASSLVTVFLDTSSAPAGSSTRYLQIMSNDPDENLVSVEIQVLQDSPTPTPPQQRTARFTDEQKLDIVSNGNFNAGCYNFVTNQWIASINAFQTGSLNFRIDPSQWLGSFLYCYDSACYVECIWDLRNTE